MNLRYRDYHVPGCESVRGFYNGAIIQSFFELIVQRTKHPTKLQWTQHSSRTISYVSRREHVGSRILTIENAQKNYFSAWCHSIATEWVEPFYMQSPNSHSHLFIFYPVVTNIRYSTAVWRRVGLGVPCHVRRERLVDVTKDTIGSPVPTPALTNSLPLTRDKSTPSCLGQWFEPRRSLMARLLLWYHQHHRWSLPPSTHTHRPLYSPSAYRSMSSLVRAFRGSDLTPSVVSRVHSTKWVNPSLMLQRYPVFFLWTWPGRQKPNES